LNFYSKPKLTPRLCTLGPRGMDKMLISGMGGIKITDRVMSALFG